MQLNIFETLLGRSVMEYLPNDQAFFASNLQRDMAGNAQGDSPSAYSTEISIGRKEDKEAFDKWGTSGQIGITYVFTEILPSGTDWAELFEKFFPNVYLTNVANKLRELVYFKEGPGGERSTRLQFEHPVGDFLVTIGIKFSFSEPVSTFNAA